MIVFQDGVNKRGWGVSRRSGLDYLYRDLQWRRGASQLGFGGAFWPTRDEATKALEDWKASQVDPRDQKIKDLEASLKEQTAARSVNEERVERLSVRLSELDDKIKDLEARSGADLNSYRITLHQYAKQLKERDDRIKVLQEKELNSNRYLAETLGVTERNMQVHIKERDEKIKALQEQLDRLLKELHVHVKARDKVIAEVRAQLACKHDIIQTLREARDYWKALADKRFKQLRVENQQKAHDDRRRINAESRVKRLETALISICDTVEATKEEEDCVAQGVCSVPLQGL
jgi:peptidoglycan hydrolase CwlO-like protein